MIMPLLAAGPCTSETMHIRNHTLIDVCARTSAHAHTHMHTHETRGASATSMLQRDARTVAPDTLNPKLSPSWQSLKSAALFDVALYTPHVAVYTPHLSIYTLHNTLHHTLHPSVNLVSERHDGEGPVLILGELKTDAAVFIPLELHLRHLACRGGGGSSGAGSGGGRSSRRGGSSGRRLGRLNPEGEFRSCGRRIESWGLGLGLRALRLGVLKGVRG